ncbi:MAG TPA: TonB family protein, partial [Kofleriaceae bacterium]|nr:TonB family protein [Kofleriaceae bacterium]
LGRAATPSEGSPTLKPPTPAAGSPSGKPSAPPIAPTPLPSVRAPGSPAGKPAQPPAIAPTPLPTVRMPPSSSATPPAATPVVKTPAKQPLPAATPVSGVQTAAAVAAGHDAKAPDVVDTAALAAAADADDLEAASSADEIEAISSSNILEAVPDDVEASFETRTPPPVPPRTPTRAPARPAVPPETKPIDAAPAEAKLAAAASKPAVTKLQVADLPQPELLDLSEGVAKKRRSRTGTALVRRRTSSTVLMYLALACAAVAGFVAVVHFFPRGGSDDTPEPPRGSAAVAVAPVIDAPAAPPVAPGSGSDSAEIEIQPGSAAAPTTETPAPTPPETKPDAHPTTRPATHPAARPPTTPEVKPPGTSEVKPPAVPETKPAPAPVADGCDEVSCVLEKYQRECCARFKPADSGFHPKNEVPDSLDKTMVYAGIEKVKPKVIACGEKSAAKGTVKLAITVAPGGNITDISVADSPDAALGQCVLAAVKRASFGKSVNGASFTFPFAF